MISIKRIAAFLIAATLLFSLSSCANGAGVSPVPSPSVWDGLNYLERNIISDIIEEPLPEGIILYDYDGNRVSLDEFYGKTLIINFWSSQSDYCHYEMQFLNSAYLDLVDKGTVVVGINTYDCGTASEYDRLLMQSIGAYVNSLSVVPQYPIYIDRYLDIVDMFDIDSIPTSLFVDMDGNIRLIYTGALYSAEWIERVLELIEIYG